ncbi:MAG TPA: phosphosulfolactate synthase [Rhodanobacteraceae bacterium]|nr:phosphosulfolactate synthase [Rhodanobacteraceae bacterium]
MSNTAFSFLDQPARSPKPRTQGVTMVLDKNLSTARLSELIATGGQWFDLVKLGWGTSACFDRTIVAEKCRSLRDAGIDVCPGGTLFELSFLQGKFGEMLDEARDIGFNCLEISNGNVPISAREKLGCIRQARQHGFKVVSEVGSKILEEDHQLSVRQRIEDARAELDAGSWKVIMEARESGTLGIFDHDGSLDRAMLDGLLHGLEFRNLIFEAPRKEQQAALIGLLGAEVNLGNIAPEDVIPLETLRRGLRSDTLRHFHMHVPNVFIELGPSGARAASDRGDVVIVVDALRATSTIVAALAGGMASVRPVATVDECVGEVTAGERGGRKVPHLDFDNSPLAFVNGEQRGRALYLTTTNGAECLLSAAQNDQAVVLAGALLNATAVARAGLTLAQRRACNITIVVAGRNNQIAVEDQITATQIALGIPGAEVRGSVPMLTADDFLIDFLNSDSGRNLSSLGRVQDVIFCAQKDALNIVPIFERGELVVLDIGT